MNGERPAILNEFQKFINRGNVFDMAVGVIIGAAFSKVLSSLVADIITPFLSLLTGQGSLSELTLMLVPAVEETATTAAKAAVYVRYGQFLQYVLDFLITAVCVFLAVCVITHLRKVPKKISKEVGEFIEEQKKKRSPEEDCEPVAPAPAVSVIASAPTASVPAASAPTVSAPAAPDPVLTEIRDLLRFICRDSIQATPEE